MPAANAYCPCQSGERYKHCCLKKESVREPDLELLRRQVRSALDALIPKILEFGTKYWSESAHWIAADEFYGGEAEAIDFESPETQIVFPWYFHKWIPNAKTRRLFDLPSKKMAPMPLSEAFYEKRRGYLSQIEREFLEAIRLEEFSFFEVKDVVPGQGYTLLDVLTGRELPWVSEVSGSRIAQRGDHIFGLPVTIGKITIMEATAPYLIPPRFRPELVELRNSLEFFDGKKLTLTSLKRHAAEIMNTYRDVRAQIIDPPPMKLQNTDGDPLCFHTIRFELKASIQEAFDRLKFLGDSYYQEGDFLEDAERSDDGELKEITVVWCKVGNKINRSWTNTTLGRLHISNGALSVEVNSENRAQEVRKLVEQALGSDACYEATLVQTPEQMMKERDARSSAEQKRRDREKDEEQQRLMERPEVKAHLKSMMDAHWETWISNPIPALKGRTPAEAAQTTEGRELLEALLYEIERNNERAQPGLHAPVADLRRKLGVG